VAGLEPEHDDSDLQPFLELAREIKRDVARLAADDSVDIEAIEEAIARIPADARARVTMAVFDRLPPDAQWSVLERAFGDDEIRAYLRAEHDHRRAELGRTRWQRELAASARAAHRLDTRTVPADEQMTVGLFRDGDTRAAVKRGHLSDTCARQLVLRSISAGVFRVIADVFNPRGGLFVTRDYDRQVWDGERLAPHASVRIGSVHSSATGDELEPVLYPGARVDVETDRGVVKGRLNVGFVMLGEVDVFAG
jgi:hypothetical protein